MMTLTEALADIHQQHCLPDRHDDACLALNAAVSNLTAERDQARAIAVALEQEIAAREAALPLSAVEA